MYLQNFTWHWLAVNWLAANWTASSYIVRIKRCLGGCRKLRYLRSQLVLSDFYVAHNAGAGSAIRKVGAFLV